jgi:chromosomal replication initiator protein
VENLDLKTIWQKITDKVSGDIGTDAVEMWLKPITPLLYRDKELKLEIPNQLFYDTFKARYGENVLLALKEIAGQSSKIEYTVPLVDNGEKNTIPAVKKERKRSTFPNRLNKNYAFGSFIEGPSNKFAYRAAHAVVKKLGDRANNPLVIFSNPGLGKTHLLHSIGNAIVNQKPSARILYMSGEEFVNEYIESLSKKAAEPFRNKYRSLDCFLIDDIQFIAGKDRSEQEFFYTFNTLFESKKQIVLTSDRIPNELALNERLSSRLLSGIVAEIKPPDVETRIAILRNKCRLGGFTGIPDDVIIFIAESIRNSIRELEGSLIRLHSFCEIQGIKPTLETAKELLRDVIASSERPVILDIDTIKRIVAKHYKIQMQDFVSQKRTHSISWPRQIAMYLANELTQMSLPEIGRSFKRDHSTVVHARDRIKNKALADPFFSAEINQMVVEIKAVDKV